MAYPVKSLEILRKQIDARWPNRDKSSDGWIGDSGHQARKSEHNPDADGSVDARDFTHDPAHGFDAHAFADFMRTQRDRRIRNIISNRRILAGEEGPSPWVWRTYSGTNPHTAHIHVDVLDKYQDDETPWAMPGEQASGFKKSGEGRGSWYSWFAGKHEWKDTSDKPNSNALGIPDDQQGFAMYDRATLGTWRDIRAPNGVVLRLQQTDIGPHPRTGRTIDIAAIAAERFGYAPDNFPTDSIFEWSAPVGTDVIVAGDAILRRETHAFNPEVQALQKALGFSEDEQDGYFGSETEKAVRWFQRRNGLDPDGEVGPLTLAKLTASDGTPATAPDYTKTINEIWATVRPILEKAMATQNTKTWTSSKTIWGALITAAPALITQLGPVFGVPITEDVATQVVSAGVTIGGLLLTIFGRVTATKQIS